MHTIHPGPATRRAPFSPHTLCNGALEHRHGSQYSPRPLMSTQKKTANVKADCQANLSRPDVSANVHKKPLDSTALNAAGGVLLAFRTPWRSSC